MDRYGSNFGLINIAIGTVHMRIAWAPAEGWHAQHPALQLFSWLKKRSFVTGQGNLPVRHRRLWAQRGSEAMSLTQRLQLMGPMVEEKWQIRGLPTKCWKTWWRTWTMIHRGRQPQCEWWKEVRKPNRVVEPKRSSWLELVAHSQVITGEPKVWWRVCHQTNRPCFDKVLKFFEVGCSCSGRLLRRLLWWMQEGDLNIF